MLHHHNFCFLFVHLVFNASSILKVSPGLSLDLCLSLRLVAPKP